MKKIAILTCLLCALWACNKESYDNGLRSKSVNVRFEVISDMMTYSKSAASSSDNKVNSIDVFVFDATSGLLENINRNITATIPTDGSLAGQHKVGEITIEFIDNKSKNILAIANSSDNAVTYPEFEIGVTTYTEMLNSTTSLKNGNAMPGSPFVMTGYVNAITAKDGGSTTISLRRKIAKITVVNQTPETNGSGLVINTLQLKQLANKTYLFKTGSADGFSLIDYDQVEVSNQSANTSFYIFPLPQDNNNMKLEVSGTIDGEQFQQTLDVKLSSGSDIEDNNQYTIKITAEKKTISLSVVLQTVEDWGTGGDMEGGIIAGGKESLIAFNGLKWADRNVGATAADFENDWDNAMGNFYQWGRNTGFKATGIETVSGPLSSLEEANSEENIGKFIAGGFKDWVSSSDNSLWQTAAKQPCPEGYRMPTNADFLGIFPSKGVIFNTVNGPKVVSGETLSGGSYTAHYWGDNSNKVTYGIKQLGTDGAYFMKWEYLTTTASKAFVKISRWPANADATFTGKDLATVRSEFEAMQPASEILTLPGAGYISGSNGTYSDTNGFYWTSSLDGSGKVYRAEFQTGHISMTEPYASRASGHSIRCIKIEK